MVHTPNPSSCVVRWRRRWWLEWAWYQSIECIAECLEHRHLPTLLMQTCSRRGRILQAIPPCHKTHTNTTPWLISQYNLQLQKSGTHHGYICKCREKPYRKSERYPDTCSPVRHKLAQGPSPSSSTATTSSRVWNLQIHTLRTLKSTLGISHISS